MHSSLEQDLTRVREENHIDHLAYAPFKQIRVSIAQGAVTVGTALSKYNATIRAADQNLQLALAAEVARIEEANFRLEATLPTEIQSPELVQQTITSLQIAVQELERASAPNTKFKATYKHSLQEIHDDQCRKLHRSIARLSTAVEEAKRKQLVASRPIKLCGVCRHEMCAKDGAQDPRNPNSYYNPTLPASKLSSSIKRA